MKKTARRRTTTPADAAQDSAIAAARDLWGRRSHSLLLGVAVALIVATPLIPSEAAVAFGSHVVLTMAWLVLTMAWLMNCRLAAKPVWHVGVVGAALGLFLVVHSLSAVVMLGQGHGRPTLNALWLWVSFGLLFLTVRQLVRRGVEQRALVSVLVALAVSMAAFGIYQTVRIYPQQRAEYEANPERVLNREGIYAPPDSPQRRHFEDRLASTEPTGPFALTNSLAGFLASSLVLLVGLAVPLWRSWAGQLRGVAVGRFMGVLALAGVVLTCLLLTKSRSGYLATLVGLGGLVVSKAVPRTFWGRRWPWLVAGVAGLLAMGALVTLSGGLDRQVLTEAPKSLLYRFQYWQSSLEMIADHPWWGCGPGNFKDYYTQYKLPAASETIADPHNFLVEVAATAGLPAASLFVLVGVALLWRLRHCRAQGVGVVAKPSADPAAPLPIYLGAAAGFLLAYPAGWAGGQYPLLDMLGVAGPVMLLSIWGLHPWVLGGKLPAAPLLVAAGALLVNLLAAGGISLPGVAGLLWVLVALLLNVVENEEQDAAGPWPNTATSAVSPWAVSLAAALVLLLTVLAYWTMYRPVLAGHKFTAFLSELGVRGYRVEPLIQESQRAAEADPWWGEPCEIWADAAHQQWIASPSPAWLAEFDGAFTAAQHRNPQSVTVARKQGDWLMAMYAASGQPDLLERALAAYSRAVSLYPNSSPLHAQLAWACLLAGDTESAGREAAESLRLDQLMPHRELQLKHQRLTGLSAASQGRWFVYWGGDPEQLMRDIRNIRSPQ